MLPNCGVKVDTACLGCAGVGLVSWACAYIAEVTRSAPVRIIILVRMLVAPRLPQEEVAGRVIRAVNLRVALDAGASRDAVAARVHLGLVVDRRRVAARDMAALAEHRQLGDQQPLVVRSVRVVAGDAALAGHLVIP